MQFHIVPVEEQDIETVTNVLCDAFGDTSSAPYGPGGYYLGLLWPEINTPFGRKNAVTRVTEWWHTVQEVDPSLFIKAYDAETGTIAGCMMLRFDPGPTKKAITNTAISREYFLDDESYDMMLAIRGDRLEICWEAVKLLPEGERFMNIMINTVAPRYQGRGIGSMLVKHAVDRADIEQANSFVHATETPAAERCYQKFGYKTIVAKDVPVEGNVYFGKVPTTKIIAMIRTRQVLKETN